MALGDYLDKAKNLFLGKNDDDYEYDDYEMCIRDRLSADLCFRPITKLCTWWYYRCHYLQ